MHLTHLRVEPKNARLDAARNQLLISIREEEDKEKYFEALRGGHHLNQVADEAGRVN